MLFSTLLQIALGHAVTLSHTPSPEEWKQLYSIAKKQALLGITYRAIELLPADQRPPRQLLLQWCVMAERIKDRNRELNSKAIEISQRFLDDGFRNIILKGQGIAQYYNINNLELYRTPGDIDIWFDGSRDDITAYVRRHAPDCQVVYHHVDFPAIDGAHIEVHFTPSWMNSYFTNRVLQRYFEDNRELLFAPCRGTLCDIPTPSLAFNRLYILIHIYRHLFHEGIGLRQLMDYYFVLRQGFSARERDATLAMLRRLKMVRFTSAVMWILQEVFRLEDEYLITTPNKKEGYFLLNEIMLAGNLGLYDQRMIRSRKDTELKYGLRKVQRNLRFIRNYPSEVLWSPIFKLWHYFWRKRNNR